MFFADDFHPTASIIMLGITDEEEDGKWKTFDGEPVDFTNWNSNFGEPNGGDTNHHAFVYTNNTLHERSQYPAGSWNYVRKFNNDEAWFICTYEPTMTGKIWLTFYSQLRDRKKNFQIFFKIMLPTVLHSPGTNRLHQTVSRNSNGNTLFGADFDFRPNETIYGLCWEQNLKKIRKLF